MHWSDACTIYLYICAWDRVCLSSQRNRNVNSLVVAYFWRRFKHFRFGLKCAHTFFHTAPNSRKTVALSVCGLLSMCRFTHAPRDEKETEENEQGAEEEYKNQIKPFNLNYVSHGKLMTEYIYKSVRLCANAAQWNMHTLCDCVKSFSLSKIESRIITINELAKWLCTPWNEVAWGEDGRLKVKNAPICPTRERESKHLYTDCQRCDWCRITIRTAVNQIDVKSKRRCERHTKKKRDRERKKVRKEKAKETSSDSTTDSMWGERHTQRYGHTTRRR